MECLHITDFELVSDILGAAKERVMLSGEIRVVIWQGRLLKILGSPDEGLQLVEMQLECSKLKITGLQKVSGVLAKAERRNGMCADAPFVVQWQGHFLKMVASPEEGSHLVDCCSEFLR